MRKAVNRRGAEDAEVRRELRVGHYLCVTNLDTQINEAYSFLA